MTGAFRQFRKKIEALRPACDITLSSADFARMMEKVRGTRPSGMFVRVCAALATARASIILSAAIALAALCVYAVYPRAKTVPDKPKLESQVPDDHIPDRRNIRNVELNAGPI